MTISAGAAVELKIPKGHRVTVQDGLSQSAVSDIVEDGRGFIWLATQGGINRYNGSGFRTFLATTEADKGLPVNVVQRLLFSEQDNQLWIATLSGLTRLDLTSDIFYPYQLQNSHSKRDNNIYAIYQDQAQTIYVGSSTGLHKKTLKEDVFTPILHDGRLSVRDIVQDASGRIWVASLEGLFVYDNGTLVKIENVPAKINRVLVDANNDLWLGTHNQGVYKFTIEANKQLSLAVHLTSLDSLANNSINDLAQLSDGHIWAATNEGTSVISAVSNAIIASHIQSTAYDNKQLADIVYSIHESVDGHVFLGTRENGFIVLDKGTILFDRIRFGSASGVESLTQDPYGALWASTHDGLFRINADESIDGPWRLTAQDINANGANSIKTIAYLQRTESLWIAASGGLGELNPKNELAQITRYKGTSIYTVEVSKQQNLWLGTNNEGLVLYDPVTDTELNRWKLPLATDILEVSAQEVWVTTLGGLYRINKVQDKITLYEYDQDNEGGVPFNVLSWISPKNENQYYLGTLGKGLWLMTLSADRFEVSFEQINNSPTLALSSIGAALQDANGNVWTSTTTGLIKHNADGSDAEYFGSEDGANSTGYYIGAGLQRGDYFYFAGLDGLTKFDPQNLNINDYMPKLYIDSIGVVKRKGKRHTQEEKHQYDKLEVPSSIILSPDDLLLNIDFNALEYANVTSLRYAYRVLELDKSWQYLEQGKQSATLMNLSPGDYTFEVKVSNRYQRWAPTPTKFMITVEPSWWQTKLAMLMFVVLFLCVLYAIYRWRTYDYHQRAKLLELRVHKQTQKLEAANAQLIKLSMQDSLTEIFNRRGFLDVVDRQMSQYQRNDKPFSILLLDVDFFKQINDEHGHECGDQALVHITKTIKVAIRNQDILARWGGEEFIIMLPETGLQDASLVAQKINQAVKKAPIMFNNNIVKSTVTIGVACIDAYTSFNECVSQADSLLYKGKKSGRDKVVFE